MEIRNTTISYAKHKAKMSRDRAKDNSCTFSPQILTKVFNNMIILNANFGLYIKMTGSILCSGRNVAGWRRANAQPMTFSPQILTKVYNNMIILNANFSLYIKMTGSILCSGRNVAGWRRANAQPSIFSTWRK